MMRIVMANQLKGKRMMTTFKKNSTAISISEKELMISGKKRGKCILCEKGGISKELSMINSTTSSLRKHLQRKHCHEVPQLQKENQIFHRQKTLVSDNNRLRVTTAIVNISIVIKLMYITSLMLTAVIYLIKQ